MEQAAMETVVLCLVLAGVGPLSLSRRFHESGRSCMQGGPKPASLSPRDRKKKTYFFPWQAGRRDLGDGITLSFALELWGTRPPVLGQPHAWFVLREAWQHLNVPRVPAEYFQW